MQLHNHALLFMLVLLVVPVFWLVLKLLNVLYEETAMKLGAFVFGASSVIATIMLCTNPNPQEYYQPMVLIFIGVLSFLWVTPIFCSAQPMEANYARKIFKLEGVTYPLASVAQVNVERCFIRTKRSCMMEIFLAEEKARMRSLFWTTNDVNKFREVLAVFKKVAPIDYDSAFSKMTIESPLIPLVLKVMIPALFVFALLLPAHSSLKAAEREVKLPAYELKVVPKNLYTDLEKVSSDVLKPLFEKNGVQIVTFEGPYSSHFVTSYRKKLYSHPFQSYDFNVISISEKKGMSLKIPNEPRQKVVLAEENQYSKYLVENCNKLCFVDNKLKILYSTDLDTIDSRAENVQNAFNMLSFVVGKRRDQNRIQQH